MEMAVLIKKPLPYGMALEYRSMDIYVIYSRCTTNTFFLTASFPLPICTK